MNKSYKSVWNETTGTYVAASEVAKSRGGKSRSKKALVGALLVTGLAESGLVFAGYTGGTGAVANGSQDTAVGNNSFADSKSCSGAGPGDYASAYGFSASASGCSATAIGNGSMAGTTANASKNTNATAIGGMAQATGIGSTALSSYSTATGASAIAVGYTAQALADDSWANGTSAKVNTGASRSVAVGSNAAVLANMTDSFAMGTSSTVSSLSSMAIGSSTSVGTGASNSLAIGYKATVNNNASNSLALGASSVATVANSVSIGAVGAERQLTNVAAAKQGTAAVNYAQIQAAGLKVDTSGNATNSFVAYDDTTKGNATLGGASGTTLTNLKNGGISALSTDAVNGSQLYANAASIAAALGGGATVNANGTVSAPAYTVGGTSVANVDAAFSNIDGRVTKSTTDIGTINTQIAAINGQMADVVKYDTSVHDKVTLGGASGTTLTKVAAGGLSASSTDAVNGSQVYATNQNVTKNTSDITKNTSDITKNTGDIAQNTNDIAKNAEDIAQNASDIKKNAEDITTVDSRVANVEGSMTSLTEQLNSGELGLVQQDKTSRDLTVAKDSDGTRVDFTGTSGARELLGVAAGTTAGSAVNLSQLSPVVDSLGGGAQVNADGSITAPTYHVQGGTQSTVGGALDALDTNLSTLQTQISNGSIGLVTQNVNSRDIGIGAATDGLRISMAGTAGNRVVTGVAAGAVSKESADAVNGSQLYASAASTAAALGGGSSVNEDGSVSAPTYTVGGTTVNNVGAALGNIDGRVTQNTSDIASLQTSLGSISGSVANAVSYDTATHDQVTLGGSDSASQVKLTNLQDAELSATSTDAVTGAQLWTTNQQISDLSQTVQNYQTTGSAGMSIDNNGAPAASATGSGAMAMGGGAQGSGDNAIAIGSGANASGSGSMAMGAGAQASGENSVALGAGSVADQPNTVSVGSPGNERRITNIADGRAPTDAVNMRQFQSGMNSVARNAYSGVAAATALTMIPEVDPGKTIAVGIGGGTYKGYQAAALGVSARITQNLKVKAGAGVSSADTTYGVGAAYQW